MYVCVYLLACVCMYIYMCVCMYIYIHTHTYGGDGLVTKLCPTLLLQPYGL